MDLSFITIYFCSEPIYRYLFLNFKRGESRNRGFGSCSKNFSIRESKSNDLLKREAIVVDRSAIQLQRFKLLVAVANSKESRRWTAEPSTTMDGGAIHDYGACSRVRFRGRDSFPTFVGSEEILYRQGCSRFAPRSNSKVLNCRQLSPIRRSRGVGRRSHPRQ